MTQTEVSPYPTLTAATWGPIFAKLKSNQHHEWKCHWSWRNAGKGKDHSVEFCLFHYVFIL